MNIYHITYIEKNDNIAKGKRYESKSPVDALQLFQTEYPEAIFLYIASSEMFNYKY